MPDAIVELAALTDYQAGDAQSLIDQATANVRSYCGWHITPPETDVILTLNGPCSRVLMLPTLHVTAVTSVTEDGITVAPTEYDVDPAGFLIRDGLWSCQPQSIVVTMTHGFDTALEVAAVIMARVTRAQSSPGSAVRVQAGPFSEQYEDGSGFTSDELGTLNRYRLRPSP